MAKEQSINMASPAKQGANPAPPEQQGACGYIDFRTLKNRVPYCESGLRKKIQDGTLPSIVLPGARKRLFSWPAVVTALRQYEQGGSK